MVPAMEPRIQYALTQDGYRIAYIVAGSGVPIVHPFFYLSHLQLNWTTPYSGDWMHALTDRYQLIAYDARGNGLSQRGVERYGLDEAVYDLQAVIEKASPERFVIFAPLAHGAAAIRYTVENKDRVLGLILWAAYANGDSLNRTLIETLPEENWEFFLQSIAQSANWVEPHQVREYVGLLRQSANQDDYRVMEHGLAHFNVDELLSHVAVPTLVIHPSDFVMMDKAEAVRVASLIPDSRLVLLESGSSVPSGEVLEPTLEAVDEFIAELGLGERRVVSEGADDSPCTILFTDVEGSTALTHRLGDSGARDVLREHEQITRDALRTHGGSEVKAMGDGFMASFPSATRALECAIVLQRNIERRNQSAEEPIRVRIGLNAGEPIAEQEDLFGTAVNLAARICARASGGQILAPVVVRELAAGKGFRFADIGDTELRGFEDPVRLYEVSWRD